MHSSFADVSSTADLDPLSKIEQCNEDARTEVVSRWFQVRA